MTATTPPEAETWPAPGPAGPAGVLARANQVVAELDETLWAAKTAAEQLAAKKQLEAVRSHLAAVDAELGAEVAAARSPLAQGWASAGDYYTAVSGGRRGSGQAVLRTARALVRAERAATLAALRAGVITQPQAEVITATISRLPSKPSLRAEGETRMLEYARSLDATDLHRAGEALLEELDPEGCERREEAALARLERSAHRNRYLMMGPDGLGGFAIRGSGSVEDLETIKAALFPLTRPHPAGHTGAHVAGCPAAASPDGDAGDGGGQGGECLPGCPGYCEAGCAQAGHDPREHSVRLFDAWVEACQRLLDAQVPPESHGTKPQVNITLGAEDLARAGQAETAEADPGGNPDTRDGTGASETGTRLSATLIRRLACDADLTAIVLGAHGQVLDVGRTRRLVTPTLWKALVARDRHCAFPGCRRPPIATDAHHIHHWADGGATALSNLVLLCRAHHTMVHQSTWQVRINACDQHPEFAPPAHLDPQRRWIRERHPRE